VAEVGTKRRAVELVAAFVGGAAVVAAVALIAGLWNGSSTPVILNSDRVARAIESSIKEKRHLESTVVCPVNVVQQQGFVFNCLATVKGHQFSVVVTEVNSSGYVTFVVR
jgi:hypothetical protein